MKIGFIPFQIGIQYENWEFDICDKYYYFKDDINTILKQQEFNIYLYFDLEILYEIEIEFKSNSFKSIIKLLEVKYSENGSISKNRYSKIWSDDKTVIQCNLKSNRVSLTIIDKRYYQD